MRENDDFKIFLVCMCIGAFAIFASIDDDPISQTQNMGIEPCFANPFDAEIYASSMIAEEKLKKELGEKYRPKWDEIPSGHFDGYQIPETCFAVEDEHGEVVFWKRHNDDTNIPSWNPYK